MSWAQSAKPWRTQERNADWSAPTNERRIHSASVLLRTTFARRYDITRDWLWDADHMAGLCWGTRCKGFCSKEGPHYCFELIGRNPIERDQVRITLGNSPEAVIGQATINLNHKFGNPLRIPYRRGTWLLCGAYVTQESWARGFLWVRKVWFVFAQRMFAPESFGWRQKGERSPVVSLLPGSRKHLASRNPSVLCQKHWGTRTMYYLGVPKVQENGTRNRIPVQLRKAQTN